MKLEYIIPLLAYFLGAIPFGYILVRLTQGTDIRRTGSGNIGATNVFRQSRWGGVLTLVLDAAKGLLAVLSAGWLGGALEWQALAALAAITGHIFTVFLGFKGGKGVATGAGAYLALAPVSFSFSLGIFVAAVLLFRYISLGSILAAISFPVTAFFREEPTSILICSLIGSILIVAKHHENIRRLRSGGETRFLMRSRP